MISIKTLFDQALTNIDWKLSLIYSERGRESIPPERLLRALLLQILFSIRSERQLVEQIQYNMLYRWFVGLSIDDPVWAFQKSFRPKQSDDDQDKDEGPSGRNQEENFRGTKRSNDTHESTTDPDARLFKKATAFKASF